MAEGRSTAALRLVSDRAGAGAPVVAGPEASRTRGELRLGFAVRAGGSRLIEGYQSGCLRARVVNTAEGAAPSVVLINTGGGLAGGDRLRQRIRWGPGAVGEVSSQAAEKVYRSIRGDTEVTTRLEVGLGAVAEWLPQETILFDRARLTRRAEVDLDHGASFLGVEAVILGRAASGETVREAKLRDSWRIVREGRLIYADAQHLEGPVDRMMDRSAIGAGARAMAVVMMVSDRAGALLGVARDALSGAQGRAAASAWNGLLIARFLAPDGMTLRGDLIPLLVALRGGRPLPRVWTC
ncbi:MAG: urease accessory protein UreD [Caulobacteraceae bacterium]